LRVFDRKITFATVHGNIATGVRQAPAWAGITNLGMDPFERGAEEGGEYLKFYAQQMWLLVPIQQKLRQFFADFDDFPHQDGSSLNAAAINYRFLKEAKAMKTLTSLERMGTPG